MQPDFSAVELAVRECYGKVVAILLRNGLPLDIAEDALGAAIGEALEAWPAQQTPRNPAAWLLTVARRKAIDMLRTSKRLTSLTEDIPMPAEADFEFETIPDERLRLFFLCAHPAIDRGAQTPLMLRLVLGMTGEAIGQLYVAPDAQVLQRLVRAKRKIRDAGILPVLPDPSEIHDRLDSVLDAIYGAYTHAWDLLDERDAGDLAEEAVRLAKTVAELAPGSAESQGLLALVLLSHARRPARRNEQGEFVPLDSQRTDLWRHDLISRGEQTLRHAARLRRPGRYQLEAAIQSAHIDRVLTGQPGKEVILQLYDSLLLVAPSLGARLGRIAVIDSVHGTSMAWHELERLGGPKDYQPYWTIRSYLLARLGRHEEANAAAEIALSLTRDSAVSDFLAPGLTDP